MTPFSWTMFQSRSDYFGWFTKKPSSALAVQQAEEENSPIGSKLCTAGITIKVCLQHFATLWTSGTLSCLGQLPTRTLGWAGLLLKMVMLQLTSHSHKADIVSWELKPGAIRRARAFGRMLGMDFLKSGSSWDRIMNCHMLQCCSL